MPSLCARLLISSRLILASVLFVRVVKSLIASAPSSLTLHVLIGLPLDPFVRWGLCTAQCVGSFLSLIQLLPCRNLAPRFHFLVLGTIDFLCCSSHSSHLCANGYVIPVDKANVAPNRPNHFNFYAALVAPW